MTKKTLVSIVTISYNHERCIGEAIDSFLMQETDFDLEIIIADDASNDNTQKIIESYAKKYPKIIKPVLRKKNIGAIANSIDALKHATGEYIALCEGDDYWIDNKKLQKQVDYFNKHPNTSLCFHPTQVVVEGGTEDASIWPSKISRDNLTTLSLITENFIPTNSVMFKRRDYSALNNSVMPFDWYLHLYHAQYGEIGYLPDVMSVYRRHAGSLWWNSDKSPYEHWQKYSVQTFALLAEVEKMYGHNEEFNAQVKKGYSDLMLRLAKLEKDDASLLTKVTENFSNQTAYGFKLLALELDAKVQDSINKDETINALQSEIFDLKQNNFKLKDEIHALRNSKLVGRVIKAREKLGVAKKEFRVSPLAFASKTKRAVSRVSPEFVKPPLRVLVVKPGKKALALNNRLKAKKATGYQHSIRFVQNEKWAINTVLVSVVVPYYNRADTIEETIASLKVQTFNNFEVIVVNDGSTQQESIDKLVQLKKLHSNFVFIDQKNQGVAAARNKGIAKAKGKYIICLDSDDMLEPTYIEKCTILLERNQDVSLITTYRRDVGVSNEITKTSQYNPLELYRNNMVITAAQFKKEAWEVSGGYKSGIGYEDWDFWLTLAEHGHFGKLLEEVLFIYRVAVVSRWVQDKEAHWNNIKLIQGLHKQYAKNVEANVSNRKTTRFVSSNETALINLGNKKHYLGSDVSKMRVLVTIPWMTFGGAETLIYNYCRQIKDDFSMTFVTGLESEHEWEYKFREITPNIYHLTNLFDDSSMYIEFLSNYIKTRDIQILHIIHNGFMFDMLPELKERHKDLKIVVTMFNDRAEHFAKSLPQVKHIDIFTSDNSRVTKHYKQELGEDVSTVVIPNGIDCYTTFKLELFDRLKERQQLGIGSNDIAVFFVGRLSEEKNPDVFVNAASDILLKHKKKSIKFFMVGDGGMRQQIEDAIESIGNDSIKYLGYQSDVAKYLSAADVFVLPSSIEGFPLSILEAMSMKVAVVASDVGAISEVLENGVDGFVITPGSASEISEAIVKLDDDRRLLEAMKTISRKKVEKNYSNTILGSRYTKLYKGLK